MFFTLNRRVGCLAYLCVMGFSVSIFAESEMLSGLQQEPFELSFSAKSSKQRSKIRCRIAHVGDEESLHKLINVVKFDMEFTDQFDVDLVHHEKEYDKKQLKSLFKEGIDTVVCIKEDTISKKEAAEGKERVAIRVIPTASAKPSFEKAILYQPESVVAHGHRLSEELLLALTGDRGPCVSTLAWCDQNKVCYGDYAGMQVNEVDLGWGKKFGLSWHTQSPTLFFSRTTKANNRLEMYNLKTGKREVCISYPGLNMQFVGSEDGSRGIVCLSGGKGNPELYLYDQKVCNHLGKQVFSQLTHNGGANSSPSYLPNGDVVFCSDFERIGSPQLYYRHQDDGKTVRLTDGRGYCAAPSFCQETNTVVFTKQVGGAFQLCSLSLKNLETAYKTEKQLTSGVGDKTEPQFHKSGKYVAFVYDFKNKKGHRENQIAILNCNSGSIRSVTRGASQKSFPAWTDRLLFL